jgi:hypothetical protein
MKRRNFPIISLISLASCTSQYQNSLCSPISLENYEPPTSLITEITDAVDQIGSNPATGGYEGLHDLFRKHSNDSRTIIYSLNEIKKNVTDSQLTRVIAISSHYAPECIKEDLCSELVEDYYNECINGDLVPFLQ